MEKENIYNEQGNRKTRTGINTFKTGIKTD
jgi:hypothetical protein